MFFFLVPHEERVEAGLSGFDQGEGARTEGGAVRERRQEVQGEQRQTQGNNIHDNLP